MSEKDEALQRLEKMALRDMVEQADILQLRINAEMFKEIFQMMASLVNEVQFTVDESGIVFKQMDAARVAMTKMFIPAALFKIFIPGKLVKELRIDKIDMLSILSRLGRNDDVDISFNKDGTLHVQIIGKRVRVFNFPHYTPEELSGGEPKERYTVKMKTSVEGIIQAVADAKTLIARTVMKKEDRQLYAYITLTTTDKGLGMRSKTDTGQHSTEAFLSMGWDIMDFEGQAGISTIVSIGYIEDVIGHISKVTRMVQLEFAESYPVHLVPELPWKGVLLEYWFAPRLPDPD